MARGAGQPVTPALGRPEEEDCITFKGYLGLESKTPAHKTKQGQGLQLCGSALVNHKVISSHAGEQGSVLRNTCPADSPMNWGLQNCPWGDMLVAYTGPGFNQQGNKQTHTHTHTLPTPHYTLLTLTLTLLGRCDLASSSRKDYSCFSTMGSWKLMSV